MHNDSLAKLGTEWQGIYEISAPVNGQLSWTLNSTSKAIWFLPQKNYWLIGNLDKLGGDLDDAYIYGYTTAPGLYKVNKIIWHYWDGSNWIGHSKSGIWVYENYPRNTKH